VGASRRAVLSFVLLWALALPARADDMPGVVLDLGFTPAERAQIAIWLERADGRFIQTLRLTDAVAYHGIGNRPGASQMNSGYRWPYGRREGVLPIWASRRAAADGAKQFQRVIFQDRTAEGLASRTSSDQSPDPYFCLSFNSATTSRDALDAVSCASMFSSDKGRFITADDVSANYHEPWEDMSGTGMDMPLPLTSLYPPRMDVERCAASGSCYDHADVSSYAAHARSVMPEIDAVTMATPPGGAAQSVLITLPPDWPKGDYVAWIEINVEGDYNATYDDKSYPTPKTPMSEWDSWALTYGYAYRGQPSLAFALPFTLADVGEADYEATDPEGQSSWDFWSPGYGALEPLASIADDPQEHPGSGADRLERSGNGPRLTLHVEALTALPEPDPGVPLPPIDNPTMMMTPEPGSDPDQPGSDAGSPMVDGMGTTGGMSDGSGMTGGSDEPTPAKPPMQQVDPNSGAVILLPAGHDDQSPVGTVRELRLRHVSNELHMHEWIALSFLAVESERPLHDYDVRVATSPIVDEISFIREGRPAKTATNDPEGAVSLMLPVDAQPGAEVQGSIGDLIALTHYYVAVRATDELNRHGPISVAEISTTKRKFATVTPCFVATAAYGSPLANEVSALRRVRDRQLQTNALGRAFVRAYYAHGAALAEHLRAHDFLRGVARRVLEPIVAIARLLARSD
jgi:hypothetical protein